MKKWYVGRTLSGTYAVVDSTSSSPWPARFNLTKAEAEDEVRKLNSGEYILRFFGPPIKKTETFLHKLREVVS
jgi:hypothetical protein